MMYINETAFSRTGEYILLDTSLNNPALENINNYITPYGKIRFLQTGTEKYYTLRDIYTGHVYDPYYPVTYGVAYPGMPKEHCGYDKNHNPIDDAIHNIWTNMIRRCYCTECKAYQNYGALGVTVCKRWLCFEYFYMDLPLVEGYDIWLQDRKNYKLDKDFKQQDIPINNRIYSLETCCFINKYDNAILAASKHGKAGAKGNYIGVQPIGYGRFSAVFGRTNKKTGKKSDKATFTNEYYAAVWHDYYTRYKYNCPPPNDVDISEESFKIALTYRTGGKHGNGGSYPYKNMYHLINELQADPVKNIY